MDVKSILLAAGLIGAMGLIFGVLLAVVSRIFAVKEDPRKALVREALPGANCGGCGFAGCDAYAQAVAEGKADVSLCGVAGPKGAAKIAEIMGQNAVPKDRKVAFVRCNGSLDKCKIRFEYEGIKTCRAANVAGTGDKACQYACLGYGDCVASCKFDAIKVLDGRLVVIDPDKCTACGACINTCPRSVIQMVPEKHAVVRTCSAMEKGKVVRDNCTAGCIGCGKCARTCKFGAITMVNDLPVIDYEKCVGCMQCADGCPTGALGANEALRKHAIIHYPDCTGCGECKNVCQFSAIAGVEGEKHSVIEWNCVGCGACEPVCPHGCIEMLPGGAYGKKK